jgi:hypothetical protein
MLCCCPCTVSSGSIVSSSAAAARAGRPSILWATAANVGTGVPPWDGYVEQALAASFMNASTGLDPGFEMDFLDGLNDLNSSRLAHYDAVVLFVSPRALALLQQTSKEDLPSEVMLNATIERFVPTILDFANRGMRSTNPSQPPFLFCLFLKRNKKRRSDRVYRDRLRAASSTRKETYRTMTANQVAASSSSRPSKIGTRSSCPI